MIGVSARPCSSSAARSAPTRPSIMSLGATASAPASAWATAVRASRSSVASLSTTPSARSTPQWPWLVYSHRQRSVMTSRSGWAALIARVASWTTPSSSHAPEPCSSLSAGRPNSSTPGMPSSAAIPASSTAPSIERWSTPGSDGIGVRRSPPATTNIGRIRWETDSSVSRTRPRRRPVRRSRRSRVAGNTTEIIGFALRSPETPPGDLRATLRRQPNRRMATRAMTKNAAREREQVENRAAAARRR